MFVGQHAHKSPVADQGDRRSCQLLCVLPELVKSTVTAPATPIQHSAAIGYMSMQCRHKGEDGEATLSGLAAGL